MCIEKLTIVGEKLEKLCIDAWGVDPNQDLPLLNVSGVQPLTSNLLNATVNDRYNLLQH
jgi:hypothetical protein